MNERVKKLWIEALTSGEYEQGVGCLRRGDSFCCLGVLCDLHRKEMKGKWKTEDGLDSDVYVYQDSEVILPGSVQDWAGLDHYNPVLPLGSSLAQQNDNGKSFPEIAKLIEANL